MTQQLPAKQGWVLQQLLLIALVVLTRFPLIGNHAGEPDSSLYMIGLHLWVTGHRALVYARTMSAGYYWLGAQLSAVTHSSLPSYALMLSMVSVCATLVLAVVVLELSRYVVGAESALLCSCLFFLSPAVWWMGIQPHPQGVSAAFAMGGLYALLRGVIGGQSWVWALFSILLMAASLLIKIDAVLLFPASVGLLLFSVPWDGKLLRRRLYTTAILCLASGTFLLLRITILHATLQEAER